MKKVFTPGLLLMMMGILSAAPKPAGASQPYTDDPSPPSFRSVTLLDDGWQVYPMRQFNAWTPEPQRTKGLPTANITFDAVAEKPKPIVQ